MNTFTSNEKRIINLLYVSRRPLTTKQISEKLSISWQTAKDTLFSLQDKNYLNIDKKVNRTYWWLKTTDEQKSSLKT
jgi:Mn-dependent DtxR family transcriptional regulator